jgi:protein-S-isoprenylcysteine O-methyltransferase Ste14
MNKQTKLVVAGLLCLVGFIWMYYLKASTDIDPHSLILALALLLVVGGLLLGMLAFSVSSTSPSKQGAVSEPEPQVVEVEKHMP